MTKKCAFTKRHYNSPDGMMTGVWGPSAWHLLHSISFNYPVKPTEKEKKQYRQFIYQLQYVLPCKHCRDNLKKNLKDMPIGDEQLKDRAAFSRYIYRLHERVNDMLGKASGLTFCEVRDRYETFRARCVTDNKTRKKVKNEKGCTEPLWTTKSKCVLRVVPKTKKVCSFAVDRRCTVHKKKA